MTPTFPDFDCEVIRGAIVARSDDPTERDEILGCGVVGECMIKGRKARAVVHIDKPIEDLARNDDDLIILARPGLAQAFEELYSTTYSGLRLPPRH